MPVELALVDLHTHTVLSDGVLIPAESARRAKSEGYKGIAFTDHADPSNLQHIISSLLTFKDEYNKADKDFKTLCGVELTHVRPAQIAELVKRARGLGADLVLVHGETITEPVEEGTNRNAIAAGVDILAHPGLITEADARGACERGVALEITSRRGHSYTNGHVARLARLAGAKLVINNDFHSPGEYVGLNKALLILRGAGLDAEEAEKAVNNTNTLFKEKLGAVDADS